MIYNLFKPLPKLAEHETDINYATGDFKISVIDYAQRDILSDFLIMREYHSRQQGWKFNINSRPDKLTLKSENIINLLYKDDKLSEIRDEINRRTRYEYVGDYLTRVIYPDGSRIKYNYDSNGRLISCFARDGKLIFTNEYDELDRVTRTTTENGFRVFSYEDQNRRTIESGMQEIIYHWNRNKEIEKITYFDGTEKQPNFINNDNERQLEIKCKYSSKNLLIERETRLNNKDCRREFWEREIEGRVIKYNVNGQITSYSYDDKSPEPSMIETPCGYKFSFRYDKVYRLLIIRTELGERTFSYNPMNEVTDDEKFVVKVVEKPEQLPIKADIEIYDEGGRRIEAREAVGDLYKLTRWKYDLNDNCIERRNWQDLQDKHSATGRLKVIKCEYDKQNRLIKHIEEGLSLDYEYDCLNQCVRMKRQEVEKPVQIIKYSYDPNGQLISIEKYLVKR